MIEHIKLYFPNGQPFKEIHIGEDGVSKAFFDKIDLETLVTTTDDGIVTYRGFLFIALKAYKKKENEIEA